MGKNIFYLAQEQGKDFREQKVEIRRRLVSTLAFFQRKRGLVNVYSGLLKDFKLYSRVASVDLLPGYQGYMCF
jgi:hypothetical protein